MRREAPRVTSDVPERFAIDLVGETLLGVYRVGERLAVGGMGAVYRAENLTLGKPVVVKVPDAALLVQPGFRKRFEQEIRQLVKFNHPNVVSILAAGEHAGVPFFVLDYLAGGSLKDRLARSGGRQAGEEVLAWLAPVAGALDALHARGVVHRDVKPGNILFHEFGQAYLSDFGIAKVLEGGEALTTTGGRLFTAAYAAPEQMLDDVGTGALDGRADQYALAATVYEALGGRPPHEGSTSAIAAAKLRDEPPDLSRLAPHLPPAVATSIRRAMSREPAARFPSCAALAAALEGAFAPAPAPTRAAAPTASARTPASAAPTPQAGKPARRTVLVAALLGALGLGALLALRAPGDERAGGPGGGAGTAPAPAGPAAPTAPAPTPPTPPRDGTPPVVTIAEPSEARLTTPEDHLVIRGRVSDAEGAPGLVLRVGDRLVPLDGAGGFTYDLRLAVDEEATAAFVAEDAAGNRSSPVQRVVRRLRKVEAWEVPLAKAEAAMQADDGDEAQRWLTAAEAAGVPLARAAAVSAFVREWTQPVALTVLEPQPDVTLAMDAVLVAGTASGLRAKDRLLVEGQEVAVRDRAFEGLVSLPTEGARTLQVEVRRGSASAGHADIPVRVDRRERETATWREFGEVSDAFVSMVTSHMVEGAAVRVCNMESDEEWRVSDPRGAALEVEERTGSGASIRLPADRRVSGLLFALRVRGGTWVRRQYRIGYAAEPTAATRAWSERVLALLQLAARENGLDTLRGSALPKDELGNVAYRVALPWARTTSRMGSSGAGGAQARPSTYLQIDASDAGPPLAEALAHLALALRASSTGVHGWHLERFGGGNACYTSAVSVEMRAPTGAKLDVGVTGTGLRLWLEP